MLSLSSLVICFYSFDLSDIAPFITEGVENLVEVLLQFS